MFASTPAMKLIDLLSRVSIVTMLAFVLGVVFDEYAIACYAVATSALLLLIVAHDYAPSARRWQPALASTPAARARSSQSLRLAA